MRSIKLAPALAAMATLLVFAPVGASAAEHQGQKHPGVKRHAQANRNGACRITAYAAPRFVQSGDPAVVFGQLRCPAGTSVASQPVTILQRSAGTPGLSTAGTPTTDAVGNYQLTTPPLLANSVFYARSGSAHSPHRAVKVAPKVTLNGPPDGSQLFTGAGPFRRRARPAQQHRHLQRDRQSSARRSDRRPAAREHRRHRRMAPDRPSQSRRTWRDLLDHAYLRHAGRRQHPCGRAPVQAQQRAAPPNRSRMRSHRRRIRR